MCELMHPSGENRWSVGSFQPGTQLPNQRTAAHSVSQKSTLAHYNRTPRSRSAFPITETELSAIASAATIGLSVTPNAG
jgi:hypothetical protein